MLPDQSKSHLGIDTLPLLFILPPLNVILKDTEKSNNLVENEIIDTVSKSIGKIAKPEAIHITRDLPKTRSGKIMRRILRKIANKDTANLGDVTTLADPSIVEELINSRQ